MGKATIFIILIVAAVFMIIVAVAAINNIKCLIKERNAKDERNEEKVNEYGLKVGIYGVIFFVIPILLAIPGFVNDSLSIYDKIFSSTTTSISSTATTEHTTASTSTTTSTSTSTSTITTTTTKPYTTTTQRSSSPSIINCKVYEGGTPYKFTYYANVTGIYGFILDINSVNYDYSVKIYNNKDEKVGGDSYSSVEYNNRTFNTDFVAGQTYTVFVEATDGNPEVQIIIKEP